MFYNGSVRVINGFHTGLRLSIGAWSALVIEPVHRACVGCLHD